MSVEQCRELVLRFWLARQEGDWDGVRGCLSDRIQFEGAYAHVHHPDHLIELYARGDALKDVSLIDSVFSEGRAAILYSATAVDHKVRMRVAEFIELNHGKISTIRTVTAARREGS